jgi:two-component system response regulator HydG
MIFAQHFLKKANLALHKNVKGFSSEVENIFKTYPWYGNLRELKNVVKRAALLADGDYIEAASLPFEICNYLKLFGEESKPVDGNTITYSFPSQESPISEDNISSTTTLKDAMIDMEYQLILKTLAKCNFNKSKAAKMLKIDRRTLYNKMNLYREHNQKS